MVMKTWKCLSRFPGIPSEQFEEFELSSRNAPDVLLDLFSLSVLLPHFRPRDIP